MSSAVANVNTGTVGDGFSIACRGQIVRFDDGQSIAVDDDMRALIDADANANVTWDVDADAETVEQVPADAGPRPRGRPRKVV